MMASDDVWDKLVYLLRNVDSFQANHSAIGTIRIADQKTLDAVKECCASGDVKLEITSGQDCADLAIGHSVDISCYPRIGWGRIANDLDALLKTPKARVKEPRRYILLSPEFTTMTDDASVDSEIYKYRKIIELVEVLKEAAAFLNEEEQCLVLVNSGRFDIPVLYDESDLEKLVMSDIGKAITSFPDGLHRKQCQVIMAEAIIALTKSQPESKRFKYLLEHISDVVKRYEDGYQLFASGFSYEKIKDQVETARIEYTSKIHKVLSDIQNQLLGLPVATVIVATQMKQSANSESALWVNSAVLFGIWIFSLLMSFLIYNQNCTLNVIKDEISRQKKQLITEFPAIENSFKPVFSYLFRRIKNQKIILVVLFVILSIALIGSHFIYFSFTNSASELLNGFIANMLAWIKC